MNILKYGEGYPKTIDYEDITSPLVPIQTNNCVDIDIQSSIPFNRDIEDAIIPMFFKNFNNLKSIDLKDKTGNVIATYYNAKEN